MRHTIFHQVIVVLLLVFALADITSGELCSDELNGLSEKCVASASTTNIDFYATDKGDAKLITSQTDHQEADDTHTHCAECFCCCTHILPSQAFVSEASLRAVAPIDSLNFLLPTAPPKHTFRPPRVA